MPVILELKYKDDTTEEIRIPAEIWRQNPSEVSKLVMTRKEIREVTLDPHLETADADLNNNHIPRRIVPSRFKLFKRSRRGGTNDMQRARAEEKKKTAAGAKK